MIAGVESRKDELKLSSVELLTSDLSAEQALPLRLEVSVTKVLLLQLSHDCDCYFFFFLACLPPNTYTKRSLREQEPEAQWKEQEHLQSTIYYLWNPGSL